MFNFLTSSVTYSKYSQFDKISFSYLCFAKFHARSLTNIISNSQNCTSFTLDDEIKDEDIDEFNDLTIINVFKTTGFFYSQFNLNYKKPIFFLSKQQYLNDDEVTLYYTLVKCLMSVFFFKHIYIYNKLNYINFKIFFLNILNNQLLVTELSHTNPKIICFFHKPNFFYTIYQRKKIKNIKKSRKKQFFKQLVELKKQL